MQQPWIDALVIVASLIFIGTYASFVRSFMVRACTWMFGPRVANFIDSRLTFIGVIHHELAHAFMAFITGAKITKMDLFKVKGNTLGSVNIAPRGPFALRMIQLALSGTAPVTIGTFTLYLIYFAKFHGITEFDWGHLVALVFILCISYHMSLSKQDIKVAWVGLIVVYLLLVIMFTFVQLPIKPYINYIKLVTSIITLNLVIAGIIRLFSIFRIKRY